MSQEMRVKVAVAVVDVVQRTVDRIVSDRMMEKN